MPNGIDIHGGVDMNCPVDLKDFTIPTTYKNNALTYHKLDAAQKSEVNQYYKNKIRDLNDFWLETERQQTYANRALHPSMLADAKLEVVLAEQNRREKKASKEEIPTQERATNITHAR